MVSRFPHVSETFIVRELDAVRDAGGVDLELFSLFPPVDSTVHPVAAGWLGRLHQGRVSSGLLAIVSWLGRRPLRVLSSVWLTIRSYWRRPSLMLRALVTLIIAAGHARELRSHPVDHLHAHYATYPALAAWLCHRLLGVGYSFTAHAHDLFVDQSMLARKLNDARFAVAISEFNRRFLADYGGGPDGTPVHLVHCGVDPERYRFRPRSAPADGPVRALCVASLQEYKGHQILFAALADSRALERLSLDLVGDGELRESLAGLAGDLGISARVDFKGSCDESAVSHLLDRADLFVLPSIVAADGQMEGLPVALIEGLACGVPVVATRLSGVPELVVDGETGLLADPGDAGQLAEALTATLADPNAALERAGRGRAKVVAEFDVRRSGEQMAALFLDLGR